MEADGQRSGYSVDSPHVRVVVCERLNHGYALKVITICAVKGDRVRAV